MPLIGSRLIDREYRVDANHRPSVALTLALLIDGGRVAGVASTVAGQQRPLPVRLAHVGGSGRRGAGVFDARARHLDDAGQVGGSGRLGEVRVVDAQLGAHDVVDLQQLPLEP